MRAFSFACSWFAVVVVVVGGCIDETIIDEPDVLAPGACSSDRDCAAGAICARADPANDEFGVCDRFICLNDGDCDGGDVCDLGRGLCEPAIFCDGADVSAGCDGTDVCVVDVKGACAVAPAVVSCEVVPGRAVVKAGAEVGFDVVVFGDRGLRGAYGDVGWGSDGGDVSSAGDDAVFVGACDDDRCDVVVEARVGGVVCAADVVVLGVNEDVVRVVVVDEDGPVGGAAVHAVVAGADVDVIADDDGVAEFDPAVFDSVSAFADGHDGLTVVGPRAGDLWLPLGKSGLVATSGTVTTSPVYFGDIHVGLAGLSMTGLDDVTPLSLFGSSGTTLINIEGVTAAGGSRFPSSSGGTLGIGNGALHPRFVAFGRPGRRFAWGFGADIQLSTVGPMIAVLGGGGNRALDLRLELLRASDGRALSGIAQATTTAHAAPAAGGDLDALAAEFTDDFDVGADVVPAADVDVDFGRVAADASDVIVIVAAFVGGRGLVPLGGKVASALDPAGNPGVRPGPTRVSFAPPHDGLEGRPLFVVVVDVDVVALKASDVFGGARVLLPLEAPAPGRALRVSVPDLDVEPDGFFEEGRFHADAADGVLTRLTFPRADGGRWSIVVDGTADFLDVAALAEVAGAGVGSGVIDVITFDKDPFAGPGAVVTSSFGEAVR